MDARDRVVTPGLISTHAHIGGSPLDRSFIEDRGNPQFWYSGLFEMLPVRSEGQDEEGGRACVDFSMAELLRGGVTTVMEIGGLGEYVVERAAALRDPRVHGPGLPVRDAGSPGTASAWSGSGTRSRAGRGCAARWTSTRSTTAPTAASCAASSRPPRSTPARPPCSRRRSASPTRRACRTRCTPRSRWWSSTRWWPATARRPSPGCASWACSGPTRSWATPSSSAARRGRTTRRATSPSWRTRAARWPTRCGSSPDGAWPWSRSRATGRPASTCRSAPTPTRRA